MSSRSRCIVIGMMGQSQPWPNSAVANVRGGFPWRVARPFATLLPQPLVLCRGFPESFRLGGLAGLLLVLLDVAARDRAHRPADVVVDVILEVRERDAHRPVRRGKATAVEQYDAVVPGQPEHEVERVDVL